MFLIITLQLNACMVMHLVQQQQPSLGQRYKKEFSCYTNAEVDPFCAGAYTTSRKCPCMTGKNHVLFEVHNCKFKEMR